MRLILATAVAAAGLATVAADAASTSTVSIGNPASNTTAVVTPTHQLQTTLTAPSNVVHAYLTIASGDCPPVYTPPSGKAIVLTQITYALGSGTQGTESGATLTTAACSYTYDMAVTSQAFEAQSHTFPTGLPMPNIAVANETTGHPIAVAISGYLIPATQLPSEVPPPAGPMKGMPGMR